MPQAQDQAAQLSTLLERRGDDIAAAWAEARRTTGATLGGARAGGGATDDAREVLAALRTGLAGGRVDDVSGGEYDDLRRLLAEISRSGVQRGATPSETATGVLTLREALFSVLQEEHADDPAALLATVTAVGRLVDALALVTFETYVDGREGIIRRQGQQLFELSTPVVRLWDRVVGVPLVGTLDSNRAQVVMEALLQAIVDEQATVAILDITGVPTVDTLVAQHLLKTVTATRLMGAECIISGIRPQTAQTIVQLGIDLAAVTTRATLADALGTAIDWLGAAPVPGRR